MLLPSALPCEARPPLLRSHPFTTATHLQPTLSTISAQPSPRASPAPPGNGLLGTCRALQALLMGPSSRSPASTSRRPHPSSIERLQSPAPIARKPARAHKVVKPAPKPKPPPRGPNKRRRDVDDDGSQDQENQTTPIAERCKFSTPKRQRRMPCAMPLGLSPSDFEALRTPHPSSPLMPSFDSLQQAPVPSVEDQGGLPEAPSPPQRDGFAHDAMLVDVALERLRLSKRNWNGNDGARRVGRVDHGMLGRRRRLVGGERDGRSGSGVWSPRSS